MARLYTFCTTVGGARRHIVAIGDCDPLCGRKKKGITTLVAMKVDAYTLEHAHTCKVCRARYDAELLQWKSAADTFPAGKRRGSPTMEAQPTPVPEIRFYRASDKPYGVFSNLYRCTVRFEGIEYPTSEHAYQAGKALKPEVRDWILAAPTPSLCAMAAHGLYKWDVRPDWAKVKFKRMFDVLVAKFSQHDDLRKILMGTGAARLVEAGTTDNAVNRLWGEVDGRGKNMLGVLLMQVRNHFGGPLPCQCDGEGTVAVLDGEVDESIECRGCNNCKPPEKPSKRRRST